MRSSRLAIKRSILPPPAVSQVRLIQRAALDRGPIPFVPPLVRTALQNPGRPLEVATRNFMEARFGYDFSRVRVHTDSNAAESAREVHARAYTLGNEVVFGGGQYAPATAQGRQLIAHELAHVIQQSGTTPAGQQGSLMPPLTIGMHDGDRHERAAQAVAEGRASGDSLRQ